MIKRVTPETESDSVPEGWLLTTIQEICEINPRKSPADALSSDASVTFVPMPAVDAAMGTILSPEIRTYLDVRKGYTEFREDDVLMAKITPCMENGKAAIALGLTNGIGFGSTEFHVLRSTGVAKSAYIFHFIRQESFREEAKAHMSGTAGQLRVPSDFLRASAIPLPPLAEQERIVAKLEELLPRVNNARERLARIPVLLKRFRQAVLAAACSGRLTADWRESHPDVEASQVLERRIAAEYSRSVKRKRVQLTAPLRFPAPDCGPALPESWCYAFLEQLLSEPLANGHSVVNGTGFPVLRLTALKDGRIDLNERKTGAWTAAQAKPFIAHKGDFLVSRGNGTLSLVGKGGLIETDPDPVAYPDTLIRVRTHDCIDTRYLRWVWASGFLRSQIEDAAHTTAGIHKISQKDLAAFVLPVPSLSEQHEIARRIEALFSVVDTLACRVAHASVRANKLTQSILARAFRGELVPTEAELARAEGRSYESAAELLERIPLNLESGETVASNCNARRKHSREGA